MLNRPLLLLLFCFFATFCFFKEAALRGSHPRWGTRDSFLLTVITQSAILVFLTEGLSAFHLFQRQYLLTGWILVFIAISLLFVNMRVTRLGLNRNFFNLSDWKLPSIMLNPASAILLGLAGFQLITLAMVAYIYPPNNWDSLTYHLSRVMHWQQNQSVAIYATNIARQIQSQPFAEYAIANLQIMLKNDSYANFVQLFAFFTCFIGITSLTKKLGGSSDQQILAGVFCVSVPMLILQSTSTQNDLVVSQWVLCFIVMGLNLIEDLRNPVWIFAAGISLGLACLTKATAFIFVLPFCFWFGIVIIKKGLKNILTGVMIGFLALSINLGYLVRNTLLFSNPLGSTIMFYTTNEIHTIGGLVSNMIRNTALQFSGVNNSIAKGVLGWLQLLHTFTGYSSLDPRISLTDKNIFAGVDSGMALHEDFAGNPIHFVLIVLTICYSFYSYKKHSINRQLQVFMTCLLAGFIIFSYYLKFQEYGSRLMLPLFVLWAPGIILVWAAKPGRLMNIIVAGLLLFSFNWTFGNTLRGINQDSLARIENREQLYFANNPDLYPIFVGIADKLENSECRDLGLNLGENTWEYPIWVLLANRNWQGRIEHVDVHNPSVALADEKFIPCAVISDNSNGRKKYSFYDMTLEFYAP
jgi:hypothetical protein